MESNGMEREKNFVEGKYISGDFLHGERIGEGKEYNFYGCKIFEGEFLKGKGNEKGKEYYDNECGLKFEGLYLNEKLISKTNINK